MGKVTKIHQSRQPHRPHYIAEWAAARGHENQAALAKHLGVDKSTVSRWYKGATPGTEWQERLAAAFNCEPEALFRHPDERWFTQFFAGRSRDEIEHIKKSIDVAFPRKTG